MGSLCDTNPSSSQQSQWVSIHRSSSSPPRTPECPRDAFPSWGEEPRACMVWSLRPDGIYTHETCRCYMNTTFRPCERAGKDMRILGNSASARTHTQSVHQDKWRYTPIRKTARLQEYQVIGRHLPEREPVPHARLRPERC